MAIKLYFLLIISFLTAFNSSAQSNKAIELPGGGEEVSFYATINLYVTKNQIVSTDDQTFMYFDDISNSILNQKDSETFQNIVLYADKNTRFDFIEKIKEQISLVNNKVVLMTDSTGNLGLPVIVNSFQNRKKNFRNILTLDQVLKNEEFNGGPALYMPPPAVPSGVWFSVAEEEIYSGDKIAILKNLEKYTYATLKLEKEKKLFYQEKEVSFENLISLINSNQLVFLEFGQDLVYEDYVFAIDQIRKSQLNLRDQNKSRAYLIEISEPLGYHLNTLGISVE